MVMVDKVRNFVIGVRSNNGTVELILNTVDKHGCPVVEYTVNRHYHRGTPIKYPKVFSDLF